MPYVPGCRHDLFISYANDNNRDGWVEQFVKALGNELNDLLGRKFLPKDSIYFDKRELQVAQSYPNELAMAAKESALLVPILSPGYLTSPWCDRERTEFFSKLPHGANPEDCLAPVAVRPFDETGLNTLFKNAQRLSFLASAKQTPVVPGSAEWTGKVQMLAAQLKDALQRLRLKCKPVFIGKTAPTERSQNLRAWCCNELEHRCLRTIPDALQSLDDADQIRANLQSAGLSVHFLGGADAAALEAIEVSTELCGGPTILYQPFQIDLTADERLWLPAFEQQLPSSSGRYQRLAGKPEQELIALIDEQISRSKPTPEMDLAQLQLALVCEDLDFEAVRRLQEQILARHQIEVDLPSFLGTRLRAMERLRKWQEFLTRRQALIFYHGATERERLEPLWLKAQQANARATLRWFIAEPDLEDKRRNNPNALWDIDQLAGLVERPRSSL